MFKDDAHLMQIIERIVSSVGRRIDESSPMVDARLPDGSRVNAIIPPLALDGPVLSIRRFRTDRLGAQDLVGRESLTAADARLPAGGGRVPAQHHRLGRHRRRQDDAAQRALELHLRRRARSSRSRTPPSCCCGSGTSCGWRRGRPTSKARARCAQRRAGDQRPAYAARPHHRRRGPRRGSARHAPGHEHRPRRQPDDDPRQQPARRAVSARHDGRDGQPEHPGARRSASRSRRRST